MKFVITEGKCKVLVKLDKMLLAFTEWCHFIEREQGVKWYEDSREDNFKKWSKMWQAWLKLREVSSSIRNAAQHMNMNWELWDKFD